MCEGEYSAVEFIIFKINFQLRFEYGKSRYLFIYLKSSKLFTKNSRTPQERVLRVKG